MSKLVWFTCSFQDNLFGSNWMHWVKVCLVVSRGQKKKNQHSSSTVWQHCWRGGPQRKTHIPSGSVAVVLLGFVSSLHDVLACSETLTTRRVAKVGYAIAILATTGYIWVLWTTKFVNKTAPIAHLYQKFWVLISVVEFGLFAVHLLYLTRPDLVIPI